MISYRLDEAFLIISVRGRKDINDIEVLLLARAIPFTIDEYAFRRDFYIPADLKERAVAEVDAFLTENRNWPPAEGQPKTNLFRFSPVHAIVLVGLGMFHWWTVQTAGLTDWLDAGMVSTEKILSGQWMRVITGLTLHADEAHLAGNLFGLLVFVSGVHQLTGFGVSWLLVLLAGALGNYASALFYQVGHQAIGASTAVFGAVGILGAMGFRFYSRKNFSGRRLFIPMLGALGIFAMLGTNPKTDVIAHLFGLAAGIAIGLTVTPLVGGRLLKSRLVQSVAFAAFLLVIYLSWAVQLHLL